MSVEADEPTRLGAPFVRGRGVGLGPPLRRMSTATVSASRPPGRAGGVAPFGAGVGAGVPFGLIDTGFPGAGRRGVGEAELAAPTVVVGASGEEVGAGFAPGVGLAPGVGAPARGTF